MDFRQLHYFVAVAEAGSMSAAARTLFVTQPTLTIAIAKLEKSLGVELLDRSTRPFTLTPAGVHLHEHGKVVLATVDSLTEQVRALGSAGRTHIRIGLTVLFAVNYMPQITKFMAAYPEVDISFVQSGSRAMQQLIVTGRLDLAVVSYPQYVPELEMVPLQGKHGSYDVAVVLRDDHPLAERATLSVKDLVGQHFSSLSEEFVLGERLPDLCQQAGFEPVVEFVNDSWSTLQASVVELDTVCLLPIQIREVSSIPGIIWIPLDDPIAHRPIGIATLKGHPVTPAISELIRVLQEAS